MLVDAPVPHRLTGRTLRGRYRLGEALGEGTIGIVFDAVDQVCERAVAVKVLKGEAVEGDVGFARFGREAEVAASLDHPGIVRVLDSGVCPASGAFLVMERLRGPTVEQLHRAGALDSIEGTIAVVAAVADAMAQAHARGIVHRDLKPSNVLEHRPDHAPRVLKVLDLGFAHAEWLERLTATGECLGTLLYMAPEQIRGEPVSHATDLYALGAMLYELLTGHAPFVAASVHELIQRSLRDEPAALRTTRPDASKELERLLAACLAKSPSDRPESAAALAAALRSVPTTGGRGATTRIARPREQGWAGGVLSDSYLVNVALGHGPCGSLLQGGRHLRTGLSIAAQLWPSAGAQRDAELLAVLQGVARTVHDANLRHPSILPIIDLGRSSDGVHLVFEVHGARPLRSVVTAEAPLEAARAERLVRQALEALDAMHTAGLVGGAPSPETAMVVGEGASERLLLSPVGIARMASVTANRESVVGARAYLPPEFDRGVGPSVGVDLYAVARTHLELLGGTAPPDRASYIARACSADPGRRYGSIDEMIAALESPNPLEGDPRLARR